MNNSLPQIDSKENKDTIDNKDSKENKEEKEDKEKEKEKNNISLNKDSLISNVSNINEVSANNNEENKSSDILNNNINNQSELYSMAEKIGKYLYKQKIMGYVTIELIVFKSNVNYNYNNQQNSTKNNDYNQDYWAIDLKFGLTDISSAINFSAFLYNHYYDRLNPDMNIFKLSLNKEKLFSTEKCKVFTFPFLSHPRISEIKMKDLVKSFKLENLIYDVDKKKGTIFNFSDVLECGNLGICGIMNMEDIEMTNDNFELWKMIHDSLHIVAIAVKLNDFQPLINEDKRTDYIDIADVFNKINKHYNNLLLIEKKKKDSNFNISGSLVK